MNKNKLNTELSYIKRISLQRQCLLSLIQKRIVHVWHYIYRSVNNIIINNLFS